MSTTSIKKTSQAPKKVTGGKTGDRFKLESGEAVQTQARGFVKSRTKNPVTLVSASPHDGLGIYSNKWRNLVVDLDGQRLNSKKVLRVKKSLNNESYVDFFRRTPTGIVDTDDDGVPYFDRIIGEVNIIKLPASVTCPDCISKDKSRSKKPRFWKRIAGTLKVT